MAANRDAVKPLRDTAATVRLQLQRSGSQHKPAWAVYARAVALTLGLIYPIATLQMLHFYGSATASFYLIPTLVGLVIGLLLGHASLLSRRLAGKSLQFRAVADLAQELTCFRRLDGSFEYVSPSSRHITGHDPEEFYRDPGLMERLIHPEDRERWERYFAGRVEHAREVSLDIRLLAKDGRVVWVNHQSGPVFDEQGCLLGTRSTNMDITERKRAAEHIEYLAYHDQLTGLPNRLEIARRLHKQIERRTGAAGDPRFAVLGFDLRRFKNINDSFGHAFGDEVIPRVAARLQAAQPGGSVLGRVDGDKFALIAPDIDTGAAAEQLATRMLEAIEQPLRIEGSEIYLSCSVGYVLCPADGDTAETLLRKADVAVAQAKNEPATRVGTYREGMIDAVHHFITTEHRLHQGLKNGEFVPYYQPIVDLRNQQVCALEALVRWNHPERGLTSPGEFLPVAEATGQISQLGEYLFERIVDDLRGWETAGLGLPVAVNLSIREFADPGLCERLLDRLAGAGCSVGLVRLEITEQVFIGDLDLARKRLQCFRESGFCIALDDFGAGYSSFNYLKDLPIDSLKIDRAFVVDLATQTRSRAILRAIAGVCRELGLDAVVEGVETDAQRQALVDMDFQLAQGFVFHRPQPAHEIGRLLLDAKATAAAAVQTPPPQA